MFVYVMKCEQYIKIGISDSPEKRLKNMATGNPFEITIEALSFINGKRAAYGIEHELHKKFREFHVTGEWFHDSIYDEVLESMIFPITDKDIIKKHCKKADDYSVFIGDADIKQAYTMGYNSGFVRKSTRNPFKGKNLELSREWSKGRKVGMLECRQRDRENGVVHKVNRRKASKKK